MRTPATPADSRPPSFSRPGFLAPEPDEPQASGASAPIQPPPPAAVAKGAAAAGSLPPPAVTALPFEVGKRKPAQATVAPFTTAPFAEAPPKSKAGFYIGLGVAAAVIFAVIAVVLDARMEKAKAYDLEQQEELAHHVAEQRLKEAEESAKEEADRASKELQSAIEITRKQTVEQTRREVLEQLEAERLASFPGHS